MKYLSRTLLVLSALLSSRAAFTQGTETEPNHPCLFAQDLGEIPLPHMVGGALDALLDEGDVDFYRFQVPSSTGVRVDMEGQDSEAGTLADPFLGLFDSSCRLLALNDNRDSRNSRVLALVPADGVLIVAASGCCDYEFQGEVGVGGSYRLVVRAASLVRGIRGRVVDKASGAPMDGSDFPFPRVELSRCVGTNCGERAAARSPGSDGVFLFDTDDYGEQLFAGAYSIHISAQHYEDAESLPFDVSEAEERDLGDLALSPLARIGTIRGRIVDSVSGLPLAGGDPPFTTVRLDRCSDDYCSFADYTRTDEQGRFLFGDDPFQLLEPGTYQIEAQAEEYRPKVSTSAFVGEGEDVLLEELALEPHPVGFAEIRPCGDLPPQGGVCRFSLRLVNRLDKPVEGRAWSLVQSSTGTLSGQTRFQAGIPKIAALEPLGTQVLRFAFRIPETLQNGSSVCAEAYFGQGRTEYFFDTVGRRDLFCVEKGVDGALRLLDEKESRELRSRSAVARRRSPSRR